MGIWYIIEYIEEPDFVRGGTGLALWWQSRKEAKQFAVENISHKDWRIVNIPSIADRIKQLVRLTEGESC